MSSSSNLYEWVDTFQFSRAKKHIARDFSDAVLLAELLAQLFPAWVELHNYPGSNRYQQKLTNWETLNRKVLARIKCEVSRKQQEDLANAVPGAIELLLAQVRKQTAKDEHQKAAFKAAAASPTSTTATASPTNKTATASPPSKTAAASRTLASAASSALKSPTRFKAAEPRTASPFPLRAGSAPPPRSPSKRSAGSPLASTPLAPSPTGLSLSDFLPSPHDRPDQDDIASSFSKILELMTKVDAVERGASPSKIATVQRTAVPEHARRPLTPDGKQGRAAKSAAAASAAAPAPAAARVRPASADSKSRQQQRSSSTARAPLVGAVSPSKARELARAAKKAASSSGHGYSAKKARAAPPSDGGTGNSSGSGTGDSRHAAAKTEFAEASLVYFSCLEEPGVRDEQQAWEHPERVQVARFVKALPSGDCLVQLLRADGEGGEDGESESGGARVFVSTPHFIECCGSQLHNIQRMRFDGATGKWKWRADDKRGEAASASASISSTAAAASSSISSPPAQSWRRELAIAIVPSALAASTSGPRTAPALRPRAAASAATATATAKRASLSAHFFTEVLARVRCNSVSLDEPVAVVAAARERAPSAAACPDFVQSASDAIGFEVSVAPTVYPRVLVDFPAGAPEKSPPRPSPKSKAAKKSADDADDDAAGKRAAAAPEGSE